MTDPDLVSVEVAGQLSGVTSRTLRRWIAAGQLPAVSGKRGRLVRLGDIARVADESGHEFGHGFAPPDVSGGQGTGQSGRASEVPPIAPVSPAARSQLEAIRDEWLRPLIDDLNAKSEEIGRLKAERDAAVKAADALREENAFLRAVQGRESRATTGQGEAIAADPTPDVSRESARPEPHGEATERSETGETHRESIVVAAWRRLFGGG